MKPFQIIRIRPSGGGGGGGGGGATVTLSNQSISDSDLSSASAQYSINTNRTVTNHDGSVLENWLSAGGNVGDYKLIATAVSGTVSSGPMNTWVALSSARVWTVNQSTTGQNTASIAIEIRLTSSDAVQDSATISFTALVDPNP